MPEARLQKCRQLYEEALMVADYVDVELVNMTNLYHTDFRSAACLSQSHGCWFAYMAFKEKEKGPR